MKKAIKRLIIAIIVLIIIVFAAMIYMANTINLNDYKTTLQKKFQLATNMVLSINGKLSWSFFPHLELKIPDVSIRNDKNLLIAKADDVFLSVDVLPLLTGHVDIKQLNLTGLKLQALHYMPIDTELSAKFDSATDSLAVNTVKISSGNAIAVNGRFQVDNLRSKQRQVDFKLNASRINLDDLLQQQSKSVTTAKSSALPDTHKTNDKAHTTSAQHDHTWSKASILPVATFKALALHGHVTIDQLTMNKQTLKAVNFDLSNQNQTLMLKNLTAKLGDGLLHDDAAIHYTTKPIQINNTLTIKQLPADALIKLTGSRPWIVGHIDLKSQSRLTGDSLYSWMHSLQGNGSMVVKDGAINGVDINYYISKAKKLLHKPTSDLANMGKTPFNKLTASYQMNHGVLTNNDLVISSGKFSTVGQGNINLSQKNMNYHLSINFGEKVGIPLNIHGTWANLHQSLDVSALLKSQGGQLLAQQVAKQIPGKLGKQVSGFLSHGFKGLFH